jgi:hypothetical protein|tara:strand:+ start:460 stop:990 length:531 start_codon:yes stop_codon:yes gene_type:complete
MNYKITDDFLDNETFQQLKSIILNPLFDWNYVPMTDSLGEDPTKSSGQFVHLAYANCVPKTTFFNSLLPVLNRLNVTTLNRVKLNLQPRTNEIVKGISHVDMAGEMDLETMRTWTTSVYYINSNNGYTEFESGERIESKENRMVEFQSTMLHRGTTCTDEQTRVVINFNYLTLPKK